MATSETGANAALVGACFAAYRAQDRTVMENLLADEFVFTSPQDDHIDKATFLETCFPTASRFQSQEILRLSELDGELVLLLYVCVLPDGSSFHNVELSTVRAGQLRSTAVYFGG